MIILLVLTIIIMANLLRTRVGRAWIAIRDNDIAAETLGINIVWYKLLNFYGWIYWGHCRGFLGKQ